ncbi:MAG: hypothetical protein ACTHJ4_07850 [Candidatus Nucleicultricaceae bacterium]
MNALKSLKPFYLATILVLSTPLSAAEQLTCPKVDGATFAKLLVQKTDVIKNWSFISFDAPMPNLTVRDPKTISTVLTKQDARTCHYSVMKHKVSHYGPMSKPDLEKTGVTFILGRESAACPTINTEQLKKIAKGQTVFVQDPAIRAQEGALLKAVDGNAVTNIHMAVQGLSDQSFKPMKEIAEQKGPFSDVCIYPVSSHGINEVWLTALLKD